MGYSPRQIAAFIFIGEKRRKSERAEDLQMMALATRGDPKAYKKTVKELQKP